MPQKDSRLTENQRRNALMFGAFVVLAVTIVLSIVIATSRWNQDGWTAVAAVAASVQAIGVLVALALIYRRAEPAERKRCQRPSCNHANCFLLAAILTNEQAYLLHLVRAAGAGRLSHTSVGHVAGLINHATTSGRSTTEAVAQRSP